jgi:DNA-binding LacI/PurR family transcriptional regulator
LVLLDLPIDQMALVTETAGRRPLLSIGTHCPGASVSCIAIDNVEMGRRAVRHLCDLGHRSLGFMGGDDHVAYGRDRWAGFLAACQQQEVAPRDQNIIRGLGSRLDERERMALIRALSSPHRPTAVFAAGYEFAMDVLETAKTVGLSIPRDLSIIAVDDPPSAPYLDPPLTTFRQPVLQLGHAAINMLVERIRQPGEQPEYRTLRPELIIRGSTGPAPF